MRNFLGTIRNALRRTEGRGIAPPAPKSLIYALCAEYQQVDLWAAYHAFRLDPQANTWDRLRRRNVSWRQEETVETLLHRVCPFSGKRTPDPATLELALVSTSAFSARPARKRSPTHKPAR